MFDALLYEELRRINSDILIAEDESRVIGGVNLRSNFSPGVRM